MIKRKKLSIERGDSVLDSQLQVIGSFLALIHTSLSWKDKFKHIRIWRSVAQDKTH